MKKAILSGPRSKFHEPFKLRHGLVNLNTHSPELTIAIRPIGGTSLTKKEVRQELSKIVDEFEQLILKPRGMYLGKKILGKRRKIKRFI